MSHRRMVLLAAGMAVLATALSGCLSTDYGAPLTPATSSTTAKDRETLIAALNKTHASRYTFAVQADLAQDGKVTGNGAVDPAAQLFTNAINVTGATRPTSTERLVVGGQAYLRSADDKSGKWMHVDLARMPKDGLLFIDMTDPVGLAKFTASIGSVERGSTPGAYLGNFNANSAGELPIGAPMEHCFCTLNMKFRAVVDAEGRVTTISMDLIQSGDRPTMKMTTTFAGFDAPVALTAPAKSATFEAPESYYHSSASPSPSK